MMSSLQIITFDLIIDLTVGTPIQNIFGRPWTMAFSEKIWSLLIRKFPYQTFMIGVRGNKFGLTLSPSSCMVCLAITSKWN